MKKFLLTTTTCGLLLTNQAHALSVPECEQIANQTAQIELSKDDELWRIQNPTPKPISQRTCLKTLLNPGLDILFSGLSMANIEEMLYDAACGAIQSAYDKAMQPVNQEISNFNNSLSAKAHFDNPWAQRAFGDLGLKTDLDLNRGSFDDALNSGANEIWEGGKAVATDGTTKLDEAIGEIIRENIKLPEENPPFLD